MIFTQLLKTKLLLRGLINIIMISEEVFGSNNALWFSSNGTNIAYATFNDTNVRVMKIPHFGVPGSLDDQYTEHRDIRYPKVCLT